MGPYYHLCLFIFISSTVYSAIEASLSKDWLIEFHQPVEPLAAKRIAKRYAMVSRGPVRQSMRTQTLLVSSRMFPGLERSASVSLHRSQTNPSSDAQKTRHCPRRIHPTARTSTPFLAWSDRSYLSIVQVKRAIHQIPHRRVKRGYQSAGASEYTPPSDPYFQYQWYLVGDIVALADSLDGSSPSHPKEKRRSSGWQTSTRSERRSRMGTRLHRQERDHRHHGRWRRLHAS